MYEIVCSDIYNPVKNKVAFNVYDKSQNGYISYHDLESYLISEE